MKRIISFLVIALLSLTIFVGCSNNQKSEEELKAEIKAEMEAEMEAEAKQKEELKEEIKAEMEAENGKDNSGATKVDMKDMDELYEFVKKDIVNISRENFDSWEVHYFDITGDGTDEAVLVSTYGVDWYEKMEIISGDNGVYKRIPSDIPLAKNKNVPMFEEGFLVVTSATSGTGEILGFMDLYKYNGSEIINVLDDLLIEHEVAARSADFKEIAEIDGSLTDFTYTLTKNDNLANKETIEVKKQYTYNANTMSFDIKSLDTQKASGSQASTTPSSPKIDGALYLANLSNGDSIGGGLTIRDIDYRKGGESARFTLAGDTVLKGELSFNEMTEGIELFVTDHDNFPNPIIIEGPRPDLKFEYKPTYVGFRNLDTLLNEISSSDLSKIKSGEPLKIKVSVRNINYAMQFEAGGAGSNCEFVKIIDS